MSWRPVKSIVHAVCTHRFEATEADDLALEIGDDVYIAEVGGPTDDWCRGWLLAQPSIVSGLAVERGQPLRPRAYSGIFPRTHVEIREVLGDGRVESAQELEAQRAAYTSGSVAEDAAWDTASNSRRASALSRTRSIRNTRLLHRKRSDAELEPLDPVPRLPGAPKPKAPLPTLRIGDATNYSIEEPLVDEISASLKEWYTTKLHDLVLDHNYPLLDRVSGLVNRLDSSRKQLIHDLLTEKELAELRERTIWDLVDGNKMLDGGVIVRNPQEKGRILTAQDDIPEMLRLQAMMSLRTRPPALPMSESTISHVLAEVKSFPDMVGEPGILHMYLCRQSGDGKPRSVSEVFAVEVPLENSTSATPALTKTLFTDLTKAEVGSATDPSARLFLVCLLQRDEPFRVLIRKPSATPAPSFSPSLRSELPAPTEGMNGGRRSFLFGGQRRRASQDQLRPTTADTMVSKAQSQRTLTPNSIQGAQSQPMTTTEKKVRRVVGYSAIEIGSLVRQQDHCEVSVEFWTPAHPSDDSVTFPKPGVDGWEDVLKSLMRSPTGHFAKENSLAPFTLALRAFAHVDAQLLVKENPALLRDVHCTQSIGFSSSSQQPRSDIYLTLKEPILPPNAKCYHPQEGGVTLSAETGLRNLQLTMEVRTTMGSRIDNAIYPTSNRLPHTAFRTAAIDRGEAWNQTIRLSIPTEDIHQSHVIISVADGSNFPFALAWMPLWDKASGSCAQGKQVLAFWDYSEHTASTVNGRGAYQALPSHLHQLQGDKESMAALLATVSVTSSTNAQDPSISALLTWDGNTVNGMMDVLEEFKVAPDAEIVKFFDPILSALDRIFDKTYGLTDDEGTMVGEQVAERALSCLVHALHLTHDRRFTSAHDVLEEYVVKREPLPMSGKAVSRAFRHALGKPYEVEEARELRSALKVSAQILKFITNNHKHAPQQAIPNFASPLTPVQNAALNLMRNPREALYGTQVILMQNFASWLPELAPLLTPDEILDFAEEMMTASANKKGSLRITRLVMVRELSSLEIFSAPDMRAKILAKTMDWLEPYWRTSEHITEHQLDGIRMCCSIIESQHSDMTAQTLHYVVKLFNAYHIVESQPNAAAGSRVSLVKKGFTPPFPKTYPFHTISVEVTPAPNEALLEIATLLTSFFQTGLPSGDVREHGMGPENEEALELFITRALQVLQSIQRGKAFPPQWLSLYVSHSRYAVTILQWLFDILSSAFLTSAETASLADIMSFNNELWEIWFKTLIDLALNRTVSMENFTDQTSRAIWTIGGDIREAAALLLRYAWESLGWRATPEFEKVILPMTRIGGFQVGLTAKLVPSAVRLCMGLHSGLRSVGLDILRSMIISEWQLNENLELVQGAFFDAFDQIAQQDGPLGKSFTSSFLGDIHRCFQVLKNTSEATLYSAVTDMIREIERLLVVIGELTTVKDPGSQIVQLFHLTDFLRISGKHDAFVRRAHELSQLHVQWRNFSSAAFVLNLHLSLLNQDGHDSRGTRQLLPCSLPGIELPGESANSRKLKLLRLMMSHYEKAYAWESVLDTLKQLSEDYQNVWDISGLAEVSTEQSRIYRLLAEGSSYTPRYFHVEFSDHKSFPPFVRGKKFIYEGPADCDRRSFCKTLHVQFPSAVNFEPEYTHPAGDSGDPTIRVSPVTPYKDHLHPINQQSGVTPQYKEHCLTAKPKVFAITSRHDIPQLSITDQTVVKTIFSVQDAFPTLLSYSQITSETKITLNPLQAAIDRTQRKTQILFTANQRVTSKGESELGALIETIRASISPDASGSVVEYHKLLIVPPGSADGEMGNGTVPNSPTDTVGEMGEIGPSVDTLLRQALSVSLTDHARCIETALSTPLISGSTKAQLCVFFQATFALELHTMYPQGDWLTKSPAWIKNHYETPSSGRATPDAASMMEVPGSTRRQSSRRMSLRKRLSFLSIGGKSII